MTPLLPIENADLFAEQLLSSGVQKFIVQPFHAEKGKFAAGTRIEALKLIDEVGWSAERYNEVEMSLKKVLPNLGVGKEGFAPI